MFYFLIFNSSILRNELQENKKIILTFLYGSISYIILHAILTTSEIMIIKIFKNYFWIFLLLDVATIYYLNADMYSLQQFTPHPLHQDTLQNIKKSKDQELNELNELKKQRELKELNKKELKELTESKNKQLKYLNGIEQPTEITLPDELYNINIENQTQNQIEKTEYFNNGNYINNNNNKNDKQPENLLNQITEKAHSKEDFEKQLMERKKEYSVFPVILEGPNGENGENEEFNNNKKKLNNEFEYNNDNDDNISISPSDLDLNFEDC